MNLLKMHNPIFETIKLDQEGVRLVPVENGVQAKAIAKMAEQLTDLKTEELSKYGYDSFFYEWKTPEKHKLEDVIRKDAREERRKKVLNEEQ